VGDLKPAAARFSVDLPHPEWAEWPSPSVDCVGTAGGGFPIRTCRQASGTNIRGPRRPAAQQDKAVGRCSCRSLFGRIAAQPAAKIRIDECGVRLGAFLTVPFQQPQQFFYGGNCGSNNSFPSWAWKSRTILSGNFGSMPRVFANESFQPQSWKLSQRSAAIGASD
jgi:hypothetical protein